MIKLATLIVLFSTIAFSAAKKPPQVEAYSDWTKPEGTKLLQCDSYPDDYAPQNKDFNPGKYPWPAINGIKQNQFGPFACGNRLPQAGLTVAGGKYFWTTAGVARKDVTAEQIKKAKDSRSKLSSAQKVMMLRIEAANPNWAYNLEVNGVEVTPIDAKLDCILNRTVFKTSDGKYYYHNYYRYLGLKPEDANYIPSRQVRDYVVPEQLQAELKANCE